MSVLSIEVPYPPSVNTYWRRVGPRTIISKKGRLYQGVVGGIVRASGWDLKLDGKLKVAIQAYPPDARRRDIDNILKALLDALGNAGVYIDDSQIVDLHVFKLDPLRPNGLVHVTIEEILPDGNSL